MSNIDDELGGFKAPSKTSNDGFDTDAVEQLALEGRMNKLRKKIPPDLIEDIEAMDEDQLRKRISESECNILESEKAKAADTELAALKAKVKEMSGPYNDAKKLQRAIAEYSACLLDKKGVA